MPIKLIKEPPSNSKYDHTTVSFTLSSDQDIFQIIEEFKRFLTAISFDPETVAQAFGEVTEYDKSAFDRNVI